MRTRRQTVIFLLAAPLALAQASLANAHHGWSWAEDELTQLEGVIEEISMSPPHPTLEVRDDRGTVWHVELGNPGRTDRSGFDGDTADVGDPITVLGNRSLEAGEAHMKAVRITIGGREYDMYPERIPTN